MPRPCSEFARQRAKQREHEAALAEEKEQRREQCREAALAGAAKRRKRREAQKAKPARGGKVLPIRPQPEAAGPWTAPSRRTIACSKRSPAPRQLGTRPAGHRRRDGA